MIVATKPSLAGYEMPGTFEVVPAEALFVSALQPSGSPSPDQIRRAIAATLRRLGVRGCAAWVAGEFGDHPDTAVARMSWALAAITTVDHHGLANTVTQLAGLSFPSQFGSFLNNLDLARPFAHLGTGRHHDACHSHGHVALADDRSPPSCSPAKVVKTMEQS